jgi:cystathionine beta-synthase
MDFSMFHSNSYTSYSELIGNTPLVQLSSIELPNKVKLFLKLEFFNPSFSIKDRIAKFILDKAERAGQVRENTVIVEASSGNTGTSVAMLAAIKGYRAILVMPDKASSEKLSLARLYGAEVVICPSNVHHDNPEFYTNKALSIAEETEHSFMLDQYNNEDNNLAHYESTGPEIWKQTEGAVDYLVACASTGGTLTGTSRFLKEKNTSLQSYLADPSGSVFENYFRTGEIKVDKNLSSKIEGAGKSYIPGCIDFSTIDHVKTVSDIEAFAAAKLIAHKEGILLGGTGGAAAALAIKVAEEAKEGSTIVAIAPDTALKYLSKNL